jgi:hypothetical protein
MPSPADDPGGREMKLKIVLAALVGILVLACSSATPAPAEPTPNIEATVEARLAQKRAIESTVEARLADEKAAQPTPTATATNTPVPMATPTARVIVVTPTFTPRPTPTKTQEEIEEVLRALITTGCSEFVWHPNCPPRPTRRPVWTLSPPPTSTPRPTSTPVVIDDYGDNRFTAASAYLTVANSPLRFTGEIGTPGDIDSFSFRSSSGDSFVFEANYLSRGAIVTATGHPKLVLYRTSPSTPLEIDNQAGDLSYYAETGGTIYLDVSSRHPSAKFTSSYRIMVYRLR